MDARIGASREEVSSFCDRSPTQTVRYLTGRYATLGYVAYVTFLEALVVKSPWEHRLGMLARELFEIGRLGAGFLEDMTENHARRYRSYDRKGVHAWVASADFTARLGTLNGG